MKKSPLYKTAGEEPDEEDEDQTGQEDTDFDQLASSLLSNHLLNSPATENRGPLR